MTAVWLAREARACGAIVRHAYLMRRTTGSNLVSWMVLSLSLFIGGVGYIATGWFSRALGVAVGMPLVMFALLCWSYLIASVRAQTHAAGFVLLPRMRARSLAVLLFGWLFLCAVFGTIIGFFFGSYAVAWFLLAVLLATTAAATIAPVSSLIILLLAPASFALIAWLLPDGGKVAVQESDVDTLLVAVMLACALLVMRRLGAPAATGLLLAKIKLPVSPVHAQSLRRDLAQSNRQALLMHALGPGADLRAWLGRRLLALALLAGAAMYAGMPLPVLRVMLVSATIALQFAVAGRLVTAVYARSKEQGLLRLCANAPAATQLNNRLAHGLLRRFAGCWLLTTLSALALHMLLGGAPDRLLPLFAVLCMPVLAAVTLLRDFARREHYRFAEKAIAAGWYLLTFVLFMMATSGKLGASWAALTAAAILLAGWVLLARRRHAMLLAPAGFPAGRTA